jgi:hypothetical protein
MNRNLFLFEIRRNALSWMVWTLAITLLITITMSVYPTFLENQSKVFGMMKLVPKGALQFKGISNINDLLSVLGFYTMNNVMYMLVLGSIYAIVVSSNQMCGSGCDQPELSPGRLAGGLLYRVITGSDHYFLADLR